MSTESHIQRYQELQSYVGWTHDDTARIVALAPLIEPFLCELIDDFYQQIERHDKTRKIITGGDDQVERLKQTLKQWVRELFIGKYNEAYIDRRWRVGGRHLEIGLEQVYCNAALSRLRAGLIKAIRSVWKGDAESLHQSIESLNTLLDLDLAIIEDAYQSEYAYRVKCAEEERRALIKQQGESKFRNLVETADCMIVILRRDKTVVYFSPFAERLTNYAAREVVGRDFMERLLPDEDRPMIAAELDRVFAGMTRPGCESNILRLDGTRRQMAWNFRLLTEFDGIPAILAIGHDITDLKGSQERVLQAERLAAIGQVVAGLAHESRNALQRSQSCLEMIVREVRDRPRALELIGRLQDAQDQLHHLYEDVRGYAAPILLVRHESNLTEIWREAWNDLEGLRDGRAATLTDDIDGADPHCQVDPFRLKLVFRNVLENAIAACSDPVEILVRLRTVTIEQPPTVWISIYDNGPGMAPETRERIFEPFFTTKTRGTGLGMAIARRIIEAHGGKISVGKSNGTGTEILIQLPKGTP